MNRAAAPGSEPLDHAIGRSRCGLSTRIHQLVDGKKRPLVVAVTAGQAGASPCCAGSWQTWLSLARPRPATDSTRRAARRQGLLLTRQPRPAAHRPRQDRHSPTDDQTAHRQRRGSAGGRPPAFVAIAYKGRNVIERSSNDHKQWRGIATRYDKHAHV
jgi:transposase